MPSNSPLLPAIQQLLTISLGGDKVEGGEAAHGELGVGRRIIGGGIKLGDHHALVAQLLRVRTF